MHNRKIPLLKEWMVRTISVLNKISYRIENLLRKIKLCIFIYVLSISYKIFDFGQQASFRLNARKTFICCHCMLSK